MPILLENKWLVLFSVPSIADLIALNITNIFFIILIFLYTCGARIRSCIFKKESIMKNVYFGALVASAIIMSGCASITTSEEQSINVTTSNNKPAEITVDDKTVVAPGMVVVLRDGKDKVVRTKAEGCDNATPVKKTITPIFWGNIIIGGLLGSTTDTVTGKMWDYEESVEISCTE
jgi:uncharacterized protein YceK